jgi:PHD/YefM family antitoxin component YafN of YafNO toxin-antitoxin module
MPNIESISILRQTDWLDKISRSKTPFFVTKNGKAYLVVMSHESYNKITEELDYYKQALEREREFKDLAAKVEKSRQSIADGKCYSEEEFDKMMDKILS